MGDFNLHGITAPGILLPKENVDTILFFRLRVGIIHCRNYSFILLFINHYDDL